MALVKRSILFSGLAAWLAFVARAPSMALWRSAGFSSMLSAVAAGWCVVGLGVALLERRFPGREPDPVIVATWSVVQGLGLAFLLLLGVGILSGGMGVVPELVVAALTLGAGAGLAHGRWKIGRIRVANRAGEFQTGDAAIDSATPRQSRPIELRPLWFIVGCATAILLLMPLVTGLDFLYQAI